MPCLGNGPDHCCYIKGKECRFLIRDHTDETGHFRKFACSLRIKHGNWDDVLADPDWIKNVQGSWRGDINCRDWPDGDGVNGDYCSKCGVNPHLKKGAYA